MAELHTIEVPDIGDFDDVEIIEVHVSVNDVLEVEQSLVTVESDKASMDIPAPHAGTLTSLRVKVGDTISAGSVIGVMELAESGTTPTAAPPTSATDTVATAPVSESAQQDTDRHCQ
ncbi:MAG: biotin/lipoyl-containing protein, partial [Pseudomonadota bacterium]